MRARRAFRGAGVAARATGDAVTLARAALGFAGGDVGFGWEGGLDDEATLPLLREGLEALGEDEPRLALRMTFRLVYLLVFTHDHGAVHAFVDRAQELGARVGDDEALVLARFTEAAGRFIRSPDPLDVSRMIEPILTLRGPAERCGRDDLLFRVVMWEALTHYVCGRARGVRRGDRVRRAGRHAAGQPALHVGGGGVPRPPALRSRRARCGRGVAAQRGREGAAPAPGHPHARGAGGAGVERLDLRRTAGADGHRVARGRHSHAAAHHRRRGHVGIRPARRRRRRARRPPDSALRRPRGPALPRRAHVCRRRVPGLGGHDDRRPRGSPTAARDARAAAAIRDPGRAGLVGRDAAGVADRSCWS